MKTAIALFIFNRPNQTEQVFKAIRQAQPPLLLVVADGSRSNRPGEAEKCAATRAIIDCVDWKCEVITNYSDINLGCKKRVSSGLDWVFNTVEEAIILEDDCLPHQTFFPFCEEMLERYRSNENIMSICGQNVQFGRKRTDCSYYFSHYFHCWGWATWKRAWQHFDPDIKLWSSINQNSFLKNLMKDEKAVNFWKNIFTLVDNGHIDTWDYSWLFAHWIHDGFSILPNVNLIANIGFGEGATHTTNSSDTSFYAAMPTAEMKFPLKHAPAIISNQQADDFTQKTLFTPSWTTRATSKIKRTIGIKSL